MPDEEQSNEAATFWPKINEGYTDEFGLIDPEVYEVARNLWISVQPFILSTLNDIEAAQVLMLQAVAITSGKRAEQPERITHLRPYLQRTFNRLVFHEIRRRSKISSLDEDLEDALGDQAGSRRKIENDILVYEVMERADEWTREIFESLILGRSFEELAPEFGMRANRLRSKWSKSMRKLRKRIDSEMRDKTK